MVEHPSKQEILEQTRKIAVDMLRAYSVKLYLFGSWARGESARHSDIDLAVDSDRPLPPGILSLLRERFEESRIPYRVEVVDLRHSNSSFRKRVLQEGIVWKD